MSYYEDLNPYLNRDRNERVLREVGTCRLEDQLRRSRGRRGSRLGALARTAMLPLLRRARPSG